MDFSYALIIRPAISARCCVTGGGDPVYGYAGYALERQRMSHVHLVANWDDPPSNRFQNMFAASGAIQVVDAIDKSSLWITFFLDKKNVSVGPMLLIIFSYQMVVIDTLTVLFPDRISVNCSLTHSFPGSQRSVR